MTQFAGSGRSWWGWGLTAEALSEAETTEVVSRLGALMPGQDLSDHEPPDPATLPVPSPRVSAPGSLASLISTDVTDRLAHARGKSFRDIARNLRGDVDAVPDLVVRPRTEADVVAVLDWAGDQQVAVIAYGGGTSVVGGVEPRFDSPSLSLDLQAMSRVLDIDRTSRAARIEAGVLGPQLEAQLRPHGLTLRHFPQSFAQSTLGGWLATRAGGHYATVLTHIDDLTASIRAVTPVGTTESRRLPGSGAGPSPDRLLLGSEGTLGVITEAWMRLQDRPVWQSTASIDFEHFDDAVAATRAVAQSGLHPSNCRLLDPMESLLSTGVQTRGGVLVLAFESADHPVETALDRAVAIVRDHGGTVTSRRSRDDETPGSGEDAASSWRSSFLRMPYQRDALVRRSVIAETFETACTWSDFPALHAGITTAANEAMAALGTPGVVTCRFTHVYPDGPAPYYGIYAGGRWDGLVSQWDEIKAAVSQAIIDFGGTITHHHAVGRDHRPWYDQQRPDVFAAAMRGAKAAVDPQGLLNPGVLWAT